MAVSGIDHTIKIFSPDARDQRNARKGVGVQSSDPGSFSSLNWGRQRRTQSTSEGERPAEDLSDSDEEVAMNGLRSRKRMHEAYQIISQNDMDRKGGREDYFISVSVLLIGGEDLLTTVTASGLCATGSTYCRTARRWWWRRWRWSRRRYRGELLRHVGCLHGTSQFPQR
jgi:hypothetical protein